MDQVTKWAVVGYGAVASKMIKTMKRSRSSKVVALVGRDADRTASAAREFRIGRHGTNLDLELARGGIDAVYIATPHDSHLEYAMTALDRGTPVLCEKPLTTGYLAAKNLVRKARENGVLLMEALWSKFHPLIRDVWDFIDRGRLGAVRRMHLEFGITAEFDANSRLFNPKMGGGAALDVGIYPLWLPLAFWGEPVSVQTRGNSARTGVDEAFACILGFENGAWASCESSLVFPLTNTASISGSKGILELRNLWFIPTEVRFTPVEGRVEVWRHRERSTGLQYELEHFEQLLAKGEAESPIHSLDDTLLLSKIMDKVMSSV